MDIAPAVPASNDVGDEGAVSASLVKVDTFLSASSLSSSSSSVVKEAISNNSMAASRFDVDDEEDDVCQICRNPCDMENSLQYPCACSGSIKFVHQDCLLQ